MLASLLAVVLLAATPPKVARLEVTPSSVALDGRLARQRVLVTAVLSDGSRKDVTGQAKLSTWPPSLLQLAGSTLMPRTDGTGALKAELGSVSAKIPVGVKNTGVAPTYSFVNDVAPTLAKLGCSQGTCHGAASGKGGFKLSLRGYAPEQDFLAIVKALSGRRITREAPERSLFLRKPLGELPHRGGTVLTKGSPEHQLLLGWLQQGAPGPAEKEAPLAKLEILPGDRTLLPGETQRLLVRATYTDGRTEDVTHRALFSVNDPAIASVTDDGMAKQLRSGETAVLAKYRDKLTIVRLSAPFPNQLKDSAFTARTNYIDDAVNTKLKALHIEPSGRCTESEFLRRVSIDLIGTLPTEAEARAFLDDKAPDKREKLIDSLLSRPEFGLIWALKLGDLFTLRKENMSRKYALQLQAWLAEQLNADTGWDTLATKILTASGPLEDNRAGLFWLSRVPQKPNQGYWVRATENSTELIAQTFLGQRIGCAKCHNHPSEKFTQDDYYHFAALFHQVSGGGENEDGIPERLEAKHDPNLRHLRTNEISEPRPLDRSALVFAKDEDRRVKAAAWLVAQDDFARNAANRLWARCFGRGIVEPIDDLRSTNPASNEPLLAALAADLRKSNFKLKALLKTICLSITYQRTSTATPSSRLDTRYFSHYLPRRLPAEELADALAQVTQVPDRYQGQPEGARAIEVADAEIPSVMLDTFGRPPRILSGESERTCEPALGQALALLNSQEVQNKLTSGEGIVSQLVRAKKTNEEILDTLFLAALARYPKPAERLALEAQLTAAKNRDEALQDALWALLNSPEFLFNH
ncbi:DUF1549 domain-containing protein [Armatimonas rosea]|uniref:DUF1553 domain-containing protein n=1 Tax=Armatimonas rosea TaxID=685828 RepID=A0A7W9SM60_ARMRO|nr:DUF1549 domain-containing protein [Armatimonas rosea]MBB6049191.1 hypothetical protein [Armatimonas rosea]